MDSTSIANNVNANQHVYAHIHDSNSTDVASYLEQIVVRLIQAVNTRSRPEIQAVVSGYHAPQLILGRSLPAGLGTVAASDLESYVDGILSYTAAYNFRMEPRNVTALVQEEAGKAEVFATVTATGTEEAGDAINNENVLVYYFQRYENAYHARSNWKVVRLEFIRGPGNQFT